MPVLDHLLVPAPDAVHEHVYAATLRHDAAKRGFDLRVVGVVAADRDDPLVSIEILISDAPRRRVDRGPGFG